MQVGSAYPHLSVLCGLWVGVGMYVPTYMLVVNLATGTHTHNSPTLAVKSELAETGYCESEILDKGGGCYFEAHE